VGYDVVKEKMNCTVSGVVEGGHSFNPFCEVIDCNKNVLVFITGWGITSHEVDAPFTKGANSNGWVKKSRWCSCFVGVKLTFLASLHDMNAIVKQCKQKITYSDDFLSSGHSQKMAPTCIAMEIIQYSISLVDSKASMKYGFDPSPIQDISDEEIAGGLVVNMTTIIS
jgi:hypothetical protein